MHNPIHIDEQRNKYVLYSDHVHAVGSLPRIKVPLDPDSQVLIDSQRAIDIAEQQLTGFDCETGWLEPHRSNYNRAANRYARWIREQPIRFGDRVTAVDWERRELPKPLTLVTYSVIDWFRHGTVLSYNAVTGRVVTSWPMRYDLWEIENARREAAGEPRLYLWDSDRTVDVDDTELKRSEKGDDWSCHAYMGE